MARRSSNSRGSRLVRHAHRAPRVRDWRSKPTRGHAAARPTRRCTRARGGAAGAAAAAARPASGWHARGEHAEALQRWDELLLRQRAAVRRWWPPTTRASATRGRAGAARERPDAGLRSTQPRIDGLLRAMVAEPTREARAPRARRASARRQPTLSAAALALARRSPLDAPTTPRRRRRRRRSGASRCSATAARPAASRRSTTSGSARAA